MNATFNIKVSIDSNHVTTSFGSEKIEDMDTTLLTSVLKAFGDVQNKVKSQVAKFYGVPAQERTNTEELDSNTETSAAPKNEDSYADNEK